MSTRTVPKLGSPERPSEGVGTDIIAVCADCKSPIYEGEGVYSIGPMHWCCHERARKEFDDIPNMLADIRKGLDKLTK